MTQHEDNMRKRDLLLDNFGGECIECGSVDNLHFHHRDPETKLFTIGKAMYKSYEELEEEAFKCDLLCKKCHIALHRSLITHGSITMYIDYRCRCQLCKTINAEYSYNRKHGISNKKGRRGSDRVLQFNMEGH